MPRCSSVKTLSGWQARQQGAAGSATQSVDFWHAGSSIDKAEATEQQRAGGRSGLVLRSAVCRGIDRCHGVLLDWHGMPCQ